MEVINLTSVSDQTFSLVLGLRRLTVRVCWFPVPGQWLMDLSIDDEPIVYGRPVRLNTLILRPFNLNVGDFFFTDLRPGSAAGLDEVARGDVGLIWISEEEIDAAVSA